MIRFFKSDHLKCFSKMVSSLFDKSTYVVCKICSSVAKLVVSVIDKYEYTAFLGCMVGRVVHNIKSCLEKN